MSYGEVMPQPSPLRNANVAQNVNVAQAPARSFVPAPAPRGSKREDEVQVSEYMYERPVEVEPVLEDSGLEAQKAHMQNMLA